MRLFVSEFVCGGEWPEIAKSNSLAVEGRAMLLALLRNAAQIQDLEVATIWDSRLGPFSHPGIRIVEVDAADQAHETFEELIAWSDVTLLIAPEFDGLLTQRALLVEGIGSHLCGPNPAAIAQCSDKLLLCEILTEAGICTIPTQEFWLDRTLADDLTFPAVLKPRDGAGSQQTYLIQNAAEFSRIRPGWTNSSLLSQAIWQPFVSGRAVSVGVMIAPEQYRYEALPVCEQTLSGDGRFHYLGGVVPARELDPLPIQAAAVAACRQVHGLRGYVGVDLIVPDDAPHVPVVVEINPRLTTSYLGYARLCQQNLLERWLNPQAVPPPLNWHRGVIQYSPDGDIHLECQK